MSEGDSAGGSLYEAWERQLQFLASPLAKVYPAGLKIALPGARFAFQHWEAEFKKRLARQRAEALETMVE